MQDLCQVALTGRLTRDPELRHTGSGTAVCSLRVAYSTRRKDSDGQWSDKSNYVDVTVWGGQGENCAQYLAKGRQVAVAGRLEWREWDASDGTKRQAHQVVAESVIFLGGKPDDNGGGGYQQQTSVPVGAGGSVGGGDFPPAGGDDDIPFAWLDCVPLDGVVWSSERWQRSAPKL